MFTCSPALSPLGLNCHSWGLVLGVHWTPAEMVIPRRAGHMPFSGSLQLSTVSGTVSVTNSWVRKGQGKMWRKMRALGGLQSDLGWGQGARKHLAETLQAPCPHLPQPRTWNSPQSVPLCFNMVLFYLYWVEFSSWLACPLSLIPKAAE